MQRRWVGPLKLRAQLFCADETAMGPGKADLLEAIDRTGSISAAGRDMGMSYRRCWMLVDTMNRCWREPLVETTAGGGRGRGARLTDSGRRVLEAHRALEGAIAQAAAKSPALATLNSMLASQPRSSRRKPASTRGATARPKNSSGPQPPST
jgi:molybdate transport system regulatory protein